MAKPVPVTMVNHVAIDMAASPDAVWGAILDDYVSAKKFQQLGGLIESIDEAAAVFGGYRMRFEQDGVVVDERLIRFTELDEVARRLSVVADYLSVPGGMQVYATYHAREAPTGACYAIDCHALVHVDVSPGDTRADIAHTLAEMAAGADEHLIAYLESVKARVEASA